MICSPFPKVAYSFFMVKTCPWNKFVFISCDTRGAAPLKVTQHSPRRFRTCLLPYPWRKKCLLSGVSLFAFHKWIIAQESLLWLYHQLCLADRLSDSRIFPLLSYTLALALPRCLSKFTSTVQMRTLLTFKHQPPWRDFFGRIVFCQSVWQLACFKNNDIFSPKTKKVSWLGKFNWLFPY